MSGSSHNVRIKELSSNLHDEKASPHSSSSPPNRLRLPRSHMRADRSARAMDAIGRTCIIDASLDEG